MRLAAKGIYFVYIEKGINTELVDSNGRKAIDLLAAGTPAPAGNRGGPAAGSAASVAEIRSLLQNAAVRK